MEPTATDFQTQHYIMAAFQAASGLASGWLIFVVNDLRRRIHRLETGHMRFNGGDKE